MHIIECFIEAGGFDYQQVRGGISVYIYSLAQEFKKKNHKVSIVCAANGQIPYLQKKYKLKELEYSKKYSLPLYLDPQKWQSFGDKVNIDISTKVYQLTINEIDFYFLDNEYLNMFAESCFPPYEIKGKDLGFFKSLIYQIDTIFFIDDFFKGQEAIIHAHEPYYQYLLPIFFKDDNTKKVVSTVQSNMPINKKVYRPKLKGVLQFLNCPIDLDKYKDNFDAKDQRIEFLRKDLSKTHLYYDYDDDLHTNFFSPILEYSDAIDFLSEGHMEFYLNFDNTEFKELFEKLTVYKFIQENKDKCFVGGCALSQQWLEASSTKANKQETLSTLKLGFADEGLPIFYHNARFALNHKGQLEMMRAIDKLLSNGIKANFILRCMAPNGINIEYFHQVAKKHAANIHLEWHNRPTEEVIQMASISDFNMFPSKFEMDTYLIAQGEAMLFGSIPIAARQLGMKHWNHDLDLNDPQATGFSVKRSFTEDDPELVSDLENKIGQAINMFNNDKPATRKLSENAKKLAQTQTWKNVALNHLQIFEKLNKDRGV